MFQSAHTRNFFLIGVTIVYIYLSRYDDGTTLIVVNILSRVDKLIIYKLNYFYNDYRTVPTGTVFYLLKIWNAF